jgi:tetratricopeptide (TPR) repeat protein
MTTPSAQVRPAHAGKAQVLMREGNVAGARAALLIAKKLAVGLTEREASHIAIFDLGSNGQTEAAIAAVRNHLAAWPLDALVISIAANPNGLIGGSGRVGQKHQIAELMDSVAPHYGDDYWLLSYHAMALSEDGRLGEARPKIERSVALNPKNAHGAHGFAHVSYESGEPDTARAFLLPWLAEYPRGGFSYGHLSWHLSLVEIALGHWAEAQELYRDAIELGRHSGGPQQKMSDGCAFLWRSELAGHPRDGRSAAASGTVTMSSAPNSTASRSGSGSASSGSKIGAPPQPHRPVPDPVRASGHVLTTLTSLAARILTATRGTRHDTLVLAAHCLAELEVAGLVAPQETEDLLIRAAKGAGLEDDGRDPAREVGAVLAWARRACGAGQSEGASDG